MSFLNDIITSEKEQIAKFEAERKEVLSKIEKLKEIERQFCLITGKDGLLEVYTEICKLEKEYNYYCDMIAQSKKMVNLYIDQKRQNTRQEKIMEAYYHGCKAVEENLKTGKWDDVCPYKEKYLQKAWKEGAFKGGSWPVKFIA